MENAMDKKLRVKAYKGSSRERLTGKMRRFDLVFASKMEIKI